MQMFSKDDDNIWIFKHLQTEIHTHYANTVL